ncbi:MAG: carbon-nitrogen hydrolase family protein [Planctomycetes bacterium]|nr:carbon-nitrogen hydrolase family protein [Planctomycetota bacterium]MBL7044530.1 carbon-nitrogen hydrolase family protein [Pirellulaceae bacterium]
MTNAKSSRLRSVIAAICATVTMMVPFSASAAEPNVDKPQKPENGKVRIAVVQQDSVPGAVEENRAKAIRFAREALRNHADIILFHEALLVGYVPNILELAEPADGRTTRAFQEILKGTESLVLYGLVERDGEDYHTSAVLVDSDGATACYRKTHLWWRAEGARHEPTFFRAGEELVTFKVKGHKCGVMICYDGDFPEMTRAYANLECVMLFWLNNRGSRGHGEVHPLVRANTMIMATCCCCGKNEAGNECRGGSNITDKDGSLMAEIWDKEGIIYADVDPSTVPDARKQNPWYRGQRQDLYR